MDFDWELLSKAKEETARIEKEFKQKFFDDSEGKNYFKKNNAEVEILSNEVILKTKFNTYKFKRKHNGKFVFKKDKITQYLYAIEASYTIETWEMGIKGAKKDFKEVLAISEDVCKWLEDSTKKTFKSNMKKFYNSFFGIKEEQASIEYKEEEKPKEEQEEPKKEEAPKEEKLSKKEEEKQEK